MAVALWGHAKPAALTKYGGNRKRLHHSLEKHGISVDYPAVVGWYRSGEDEIIAPLKREDFDILAHASGFYADPVRIEATFNCIQHERVVRRTCGRKLSQLLSHLAAGKHYDVALKSADAIGTALEQVASAVSLREVESVRTARKKRRILDGGRMSTQPNRRAFSYRDEEVLVRYLIADLERKLSGRHETRILRIIPSDHCHLGVLGPRDPHVVQPEPLEPDADTATVTADVGQPTRPIGVTTPTPDTEGEEPGEPTTKEAATEQVRLPNNRGRCGTRHGGLRRLSGLRSRHRARRSDQSLRCWCGFAVYTQHFPDV